MSQEDQEAEADSDHEEGMGEGGEGAAMDPSSFFQTPLETLIRDRAKEEAQRKEERKAEKGHG
jgi:hypothetical protein